MSGKPRNFSQALDELEDLSTSTAQDLKGKLQSEIHRLEEKLKDLRPELEGLKERVEEEAHKAKEKVEAQVKENPWATIGLIGLVFFVVGFVFASRRRD